MKRFLSIFLIAVMLVGMVPLNALAVEAAPNVQSEATAADLDSASVWDGTIATGFATGDGGQDTPYIIETASQLAYLAQSVNAGTNYSGKYISLANDIDLDDLPWTPIGTSDHPFYGAFYGNGFTISNLRLTTTFVDAGLFGYLSGGTIKDVILKGAMMKYTIPSTYAGASVTAGGIVGNNRGCVQGCKADITINLNNNNGAKLYVGGLVGYQTGVTASISQSHASVSITVTGSGEVGGAVGWNLYSSRVYDTSSTGSITSSGTGNVGGLAGSCTYATIQNCYSTANVSHTPNSFATAGGLVGALEGSSASTENCYATGTVYAAAPNGASAGGLIGYYYPEASTNHIKNCYSGSTSVKSALTAVTEGQNSNTGKLVGKINGTATVSNCYVNSAMSVSRTYYNTYDTGGCNSETIKENLTSNSANCTIEGNNTFTYGTHKPRQLVGWNVYDPFDHTSDPWVDNGNDPILYTQKQVRGTIRYIRDGVVFKVYHEYISPRTGVELTSPDIPGYTPNLEKVELMGDADTLIDIIYTRISHNLVVTCKDAKGNVLETYTEKIAEGQGYSIPVKQLTGYTPQQEYLTGTMGSTDQTAEVIYDVHTHTVTIQYLYLSDDSVAAQAYTAQVDYGQSLTVESPVLLGYKVATEGDESVHIDHMPDHDYTKTVYYIEAEAQAYTITTLLGDKGVSGVSVSFGDQTKLTDSNGVAVFNYLYGTTSVNLQITKDGYTSGIYNNAVEYQLKNSMGIDYFNMWVDTASDPNYSVQGISCFGTSIEKDFGVINTKYDGFIPIVLKGNVPDSDKITKILLVQEVESSNVDDNDETIGAGEGSKVRKILCTATPGDGVLADDGVCTFQPKGTMFAYNAKVRYPVYAYMYTELGNEPIIQELKIDVIQFSTNLKFDGLFDGMEFSLADTGLSFLDGTKISFELADKYKVGCPFSVEIKNNEVYIAYDLSDEFEKEIKAMDKKGYVKEMRDDETRIENYMKAMNKAVDKKFEKNKYIHSNSTSSFEIEAEAAGGMAFTVYGDGKIAMKSYLRMAVSMKASWTSDFVVVFIPVTVTVSAGVEGELTVTGLGYDFEHQEIVWPSTKISLGMNLGISAGIGNRYASVGAFGRFKINTNIVIGEKTYFDALVLNGEGGFYAKLDLGLLTLYGEKSWTFLNKTIRLVPKGGIQVMSATATSSAKGYLGEYEGLPVYDVSAYALEEEVTTVTPPKWDVPSSTLLAPNSLDSAAEQIISIGNYRVVVYFGNAPDREISNAKALYYRVQNTTNGTWSNAMLVDDNGTSDTAFDLIVYQGKLYLAYTQANTTFFASDYNNTAELINEMTYAQDISVAVFDGDTGTFQDITQITADGYYDSIPTFGIANDTLYLAWNKNTSHDDTTTFCMNTENYIWCTSYDGSAWSDPKCIMNRCYPVVDMAITDLSGKMHVALIVDEDASLYTEDDRNIYFADLGGNVTFLDCYGAGISELQAVKHAGQSLLLWKKGSVIMATSAVDATPYQFSAEGQAIGENYSLIAHNSSVSALIWAEKDIEPPETFADKVTSSKLYITYRHSLGDWTAPVELTSVPYHLMSYSALSDGMYIYLAFTDTNIVIDEASNNAASMFSKLCHKGIRLFDVLTVDTYEATKDVEQGKVNINVIVKNNGAFTIGKIALTLNDYYKIPTEAPDIILPGGGVEILAITPTKAEKEYYKQITKKYDLGNFSVNLLPGETKEIKIQIDLKDDMVLEDYVVTGKIAADASASGGATVGGTTISKPVVGTFADGVSTETLYPDLSVTGEYIIIGEVEYLSVRVENIGKGTATGTMKVVRPGATPKEDATVCEVDITGLMTKNVKYYLIRLEKDFFERTNETFACRVVCANDQDNSNNSATIEARKLEGAPGTQKDTLVEAPILSDYQQTFDKYEENAADVQVDITINDDTVCYMGCVDADMNSVDPTLMEDADGKTLHITFSKDALQSLELGNYEYTFLFLTERGYIDAVFNLIVEDNTPIPLVGQITIVDANVEQLIPVDTVNRGMLLGIDLTAVNTNQVTFQWIIDDTVVSTDRDFLIGQEHLGKQIYAKITGVAPYYGEMVSQTVQINRVQRKLDVPVVLPESSEGNVLLQSVFHVGNDSLHYGFATVNEWTAVTNWQTSNQLELPEKGTYYLFMMAPGSEIYEQVVSASTVYTYGQPECTITQKGRTLNYEDLIYVIDIFDLTGAENVDLNKDAGLLVWSVDEFEALDEIAFDAEHANPGLKPYRNTGYYYGSSEGIFTRDLYKEAYYVGYLKLADGSYVYSEPKLYSPAIYAYSMLSKSSTSAETKELCVALLNYISAAQMYFDKNTPAADLVNADLTADQKTLNWENISFNLAPEVPADKQVERDANVFTGTGKNLLFEEMISIVSIFKIDDSVIADAKEYGTIYWTAEQFAALEGAPSIDNIGAGTKTGMSVYRGNAGQWYSQAPEIAAKNMADTQYFYLGYVIHADGSVSYSGVQSYTVEQYISNTVGKTSTSDEMRAFAQWLYFYERAAKDAIG